jgi:hypothetical protein
MGTTRRWPGRVSGAASAIACGVLLVSNVAFAQAPVAPLHADNGVSEGSTLPTRAAFTPLRLSLTQGLFPIGSTLPGCDSREDASGNSLNGFALQRLGYVQLVPHLVLHGFSSAGCAVDSGIGGGFTYEARVSKSLWLVSSVGFYALPALDSARSALVSSSARVDLVKNLGSARTLSFGLGVRQRSGAAQFNAVNFGGSF